MNELHELPFFLPKEHYSAAAGGQTLKKQYHLIISVSWWTLPPPSPLTVHHKRPFISQLNSAGTFKATLFDQYASHDNSRPSLVVYIWSKAHSS